MSALNLQIRYRGYLYMDTATINKDFRITIPKEIRKSLGISPGQKMTVKASGGVVSVIPEKSTKESKQA